MQPSPAPEPSGRLSMTTASADHGAWQQQGLAGENQALKEQLAQLRRELDEKQHMLDQVLSDYIHTQSDLEEKTRALFEKDEQISGLRQSQAFPAEGRGLESADTGQEAVKREAGLRHELDRLEAELAEERLAQRDTRDKWLSAEKRLEVATRRADSLESQAATLQSQVAAGARDEVSARELTKQVIRKAVDDDRRERMRDAANDEAKVKELQDLVDFFKRNSERNSELVGELTVKLEGLSSAVRDPQVTGGRADLDTMPWHR